MPTIHSTGIGSAPFGLITNDFDTNNFLVLIKYEKMQSQHPTTYSTRIGSAPYQISGVRHDHCRHQIDFLSFHLSFHDTIRDDSSITSLLFIRHKFINLKSCKLIAIKSSMKLEYVIQQIKSLNRLVSFGIYESNGKNLDENDKYELTRTMLMHKSSSLHSLVLDYSNEYLDTSNYTSIPVNLQSLKLIISGSSSTTSFYSLLPILRHCHTVRHLRILFDYKEFRHDNNINVPNHGLIINDNNLPILTQMISLDLIIVTRYDYHSISYILRCMPNLQHFHFLLWMKTVAWPFPGDLIDGHVWKQIFELYVPCLSKFEFHMSIVKGILILKLKTIVNSFKYFVKKYSDWHMIIDRWTKWPENGVEYIVLRTLNYHKHNVDVYMCLPSITTGTFETRSTLKIKKKHHLFYRDMKELTLCMTDMPPVISWSSPLYQQVKSLIIDMTRFHEYF